MVVEKQLVEEILIKCFKEEVKPNLSVLAEGREMEIRLSDCINRVKAEIVKESETGIRDISVSRVLKEITLDMIIRVLHIYNGFYFILIEDKDSLKKIISSSCSYISRENLVRKKYEIIKNVIDNVFSSEENIQIEISLFKETDYFGRVLQKCKLKKLLSYMEETLKKKPIAYTVVNPCDLCPLLKQSACGEVYHIIATNKFGKFFTVTKVEDYENSYKYGFFHILFSELLVYLGFKFLHTYEDFLKEFFEIKAKIFFENCTKLYENIEKQRKEATLGGESVLMIYTLSDLCGTACEKIDLRIEVLATPDGKIFVSPSPTKVKSFGITEEKDNKFTHYLTRLEEMLKKKKNVFFCNREYFSKQVMLWKEVENVQNYTAITD
jgi:hypothetical protein